MHGTTGHRLSMVIFLVAALAAGIWWGLRPEQPVPEEVEMAPRLPRISPDYEGIIVPPNIAPLNFAVREEGQRFVLRIYGEEGEAIEVLSRSPALAIPPGRWRSLLDSNRGKDLHWDILAQAGGQWRQYQSIVNHVAEEEIDDYLVYRRMEPVHNLFRDMALHQRVLCSYQESVLFKVEPLDKTCVNCHSFVGNNPRRMLLGIRTPGPGQLLPKATLLAEEDRVTKLAIPFGYTAWHPSGRMAAYSTSSLRQFFHLAGSEVRDVVDRETGLAYCRFEAHRLQWVPGASDRLPVLSTNPAWSPDGRNLYFCRAAKLWTERDSYPPSRYAEVRYSLMRMSYDVDTDQWGDAQTVLAPEQTGLSILLPRIAPNGRFLLFCMCRYGCFPAFQQTSDLYMMDLRNGTYTRCLCNSEFSESWHSWSSNSRWIAFSSKRPTGIFTRCYLSFVDPAGETHKPFLVPQSDPEYYDSSLHMMGLPELLTGPVPVSAAALLRAVRSRETIPEDMPSGLAPGTDMTGPYR